MIDEVRTGNAAVDALLNSLEGLEELPLAEQVVVFERAHEQLRGALDGRAEQSSDEAERSDESSEPLDGPSEP